VSVTLEDLERIDWDKGAGLVPAIVQHADSAEVLMLGYMNREALRATLETGRVIMTGPPDDLRGDSSLRRAYLGY